MQEDKNSNGNYEHWVNCKWRPIAAWTYIVLCLFDFIISPVIFSWFQYGLGQPISQWVPLTLQGSGIIHISFGSIIGIAAWGRTMEKIRLGNSNDYQNRYYSGEYRKPRYNQPYEDR
jgi:hypothetical protein